MKQVVIAKENNYNRLLTPKWTHEYLKRKGIENYVYGFDINDKEETVFKLLDPEELNNPTEPYYVFYSRTCVKEFNRVVHKDEIKTGKLFEDREDKDLINIAKEINDKSVIKVIEIPDDVEYYICEYDYCGGEYITEKHRTWE